MVVFFTAEKYYFQSANEREMMPTNRKPEIVGGHKKAVASAKGKVEPIASDKKSGGKNELSNISTTDATANKKGPKGKQRLGL